MKRVTVAKMEDGGGDDALYVDGVLVYEGRIDPADIAEAAGSDPIVFRHITVQDMDDWPESEKGLVLA